MKQTQLGLFDPPDHDRVGKYARKHPSTSREAAYLCCPSFSSQRAIVLIAVAVADNHGVTVAEIADAMGVSRNQIATRMLELRESQWVKRAVVGVNRDGTPIYRQRATGRRTHGIVHVLNPEARAKFDEWVDEGERGV